MNDLATTEKIMPPVAQLPALFGKPGVIEKLLADIRSKALAEAPDLTTKKGRGRIASLAANVAKAKVALDDAGKQLNEDKRAQINAVDAERRQVREYLDALKVEVRKPLTDWEAAEESRIAALHRRLEALDPDRADAFCPSAQIASVIADIEAIAIDATWDELQERAGNQKAGALAVLRSHLRAAEKREADEAELIRLRADAAAREQRDAEERERIAAEAAEAERQRVAAAEAKRQAEEAEARRIAAEKAEADRQAQIERDKQEAAARAAKEAEERAAKAAADAARAAEEKAAEERRAAAAREAELQRRIDEEKAATERAAQVERDRAAAERRAEEDARVKREKDKAHRARIRGEILAAVAKIGTSPTPSAVADALMQGKIPHVTVQM